MAHDYFSRFPVLDTDGFERLGDSSFTEPKTIAVSARIKRSTSNAVTRAAKANSQTKAALIEAAVQAYLKDKGWLKRGRSAMS